MKGRSLSLLEVFAGKANLWELAERSGRWRVLFAQDKLYGLDLLNPEHMEMMKDVIRTQEPDVATLAQPCGPWSSWQRMRKSGGSIYPLGICALGLVISDCKRSAGCTGATQAERGLEYPAYGSTRSGA